MDLPRSKARDEIVEVLELALTHAHDVGETSSLGGGLIRLHVGGIAQVDHGPGKLHEVAVLDAQLTGGLNNRGDVRSGRGNLRAHLLNGSG